MCRCLIVLLSLALFAGCGDQANNAYPVGEEVTAASFNAEGAPTVEFSVPDMMCPESCAVAAREILSSQNGVKEVLVDFDTKTATVAVDEGEFKVDSALAALADRGFVHSEVKAPSAKTAPRVGPKSPSNENPSG